MSGEQRERVARHGRPGGRGGAAEIVTRRQRPRGGAGFFYEPSLVVGVDQAAEIVQREVFGPVVTVQRRPTRRRRWRGPTASTTASPRACGPRDVGRAMRMAKALRFGTVWVNDHIPLGSEMPHGGFKQSGYGKDMSMYAVEAYTEVKHVMVKH